MSAGFGEEVLVWDILWPHWVHHGLHTGGITKLASGYFKYICRHVERFVSSTKIGLWVRHLLCQGYVCDFESNADAFTVLELPMQ